MPDEVNILPGHGKGGRQPTRRLLDSLSGHDDPGMFGRMFPNLDPLAVDDAALKELADAMRDADPASAEGNNIRVPAGFTYLGQFIDHDITLDLTSFGDKEADPVAVENFRTPALDLDSVYGLGPDGSRQLYARNPGDADGKAPGPKLLLGRTISVDSVTVTPRNDLPRSPEGFALIGDHRNDENLVVAQTHLAMLKFHNRVCDHLAASGVPAGDLFAEARQTVTWHYQWMVLHDFVERITEKGIVDRILDQGRRFYRFRKTPYMPVEFSAAAFRPRSTCCSALPACRAASSATSRPSRCGRHCRFRCCQATGSSTGAASTRCCRRTPPACGSTRRAGSIRS
jgi:Animal haem peroxidase